MVIMVMLLFVLKHPSTTQTTQPIGPLAETDDLKRHVVISVEGKAHDAPVLSVRVVVYQGKLCDAHSLRKDCRTRSVSQQGANNSECPPMSGCLETAMLQPSVKFMPEPNDGPKCALFEGNLCRRRLWFFEISFSTPLSGYYLVHIRKEYESLSHSLLDCSFDALKQQTSQLSGFLGEASPTSPLVVHVAQPAPAVHGYWMRDPSTAACPHLGVEQTSQHYRWMEPDGTTVGCLAPREATQWARVAQLRQLIILGDSVGRELWQPIQHLLHAADVEVRYIELKPKPVPTRFNVLEAVRHHLGELALGGAARHTTLLVNPASLWWCAFGSLEDYAWAMDQILPLLEAWHRRTQGRIFLWSGTAVYPINYHLSLATSNKVCMTEPRVEMLNKITEERLSILAPHVAMIDLWFMSAAREDDPMSPTDMRHNGLATYLEMGLVVIREITTTVQQI